MTLSSRFPSRSFCRYLWTIGNYQAIVKNYESNPIYRKLFISGTRKLDLDSIYLTALLHLNRKEDLAKSRKKIITLKDSGLLPFRLELNQFAINELNIEPNNIMAKAYDALQAFQESKNINFFWKKYCTNRTVAVVGNGPLEFAQGKNIDQASTVLRFNKFRTYGFENYVGSKTTAWCRICDIRLDDDMANMYDKIKVNILTDHPLFIPVGTHFLDSILDTHKIFYFIPQNLTIHLAHQLGAIPSSGARLLCSLAQHKRQLNIQSIISGFSFLNSSFNKKKFDHYFEEKSESRERAHSITNEVSLLRELFKS